MYEGGQKTTIEHRGWSNESQDVFTSASECPLSLAAAQRAYCSTCFSPASDCVPARRTGSLHSIQISAARSCHRSLSTSFAAGKPEEHERPVYARASRRAYVAPRVLAVGASIRLSNSVSTVHGLVLRTSTSLLSRNQALPNHSLTCFT